METSETSNLTILKKFNGTVIILEDVKTSIKIIDGKETETIAFMGSFGTPKSSEVGVGLWIVSPGKDPLDPINWIKGTFWGLSEPHLIIRSWRAMKILQETSIFDEYTPEKCWSAGGRFICKDDQDKLDKLSKLWKNPEKFKTRRIEILEMVPSDEDLLKITNTFTSLGINYNENELKKEMRPRDPEKLLIDNSYPYQGWKKL